MQKSKGFTIVEVLIVIVIIGILAAIVMAVAGGIKNGPVNREPSYAIDTPDGTTYWTSHYEEKDGCVAFESWGRQNKTCGSYTVRTW